MAVSSQPSTISFEQLVPEGGVAIIAPHPDDETLGCGGLIATALAARRSVLVIVVTDGGGSHPSIGRHEMARLREAELRHGLEALGLPDDWIVSLALEDGSLEAVGSPALAGKLSASLERHDVAALFATSAEDPHPDHRAVFHAARAVAGRLGAALWTYPIRAHVVDGFAGGAGLVRLSIGDVVDRKRAAIACHASQLGGLITDDPSGFSLTQADLDRHTEPWEIFRRVELDQTDAMVSPAEG